MVFQEINSKLNYRIFREADRISLGLSKSKLHYFVNDIYVLQIRLRKLEYVLNCNKNPIRILVRKYLYRKTSNKLGVTIPPNTFGPGLAIAHRGNIVVNGGARIGANCRVHVGVNIGTKAGGQEEAPRIGNNCYLGPGAKLFGRITIGDNTMVGANSVVNKDFPDGNQTIAGVPARVISKKSSFGSLTQGFKL